MKSSKSAASPRLRCSSAWSWPAGMDRRHVEGSMIMRTRRIQFLGNLCKRRGRGGAQRRMKMKSLFLWGATLILSGLVFAQGADQDLFRTCVRDVNSTLKIRVSFGISRDNLLKTKPYFAKHLRFPFPPNSITKL